MTEEISCIKDGMTGICRDLKDKTARASVEELKTKVNEVVDVVNGLPTSGVLRQRVVRATTATEFCQVLKAQVQDTVSAKTTLTIVVETMPALTQFTQWYMYYHKQITDKDGNVTSSETTTTDRYLGDMTGCYQLIGDNIGNNNNGYMTFENKTYTGMYKGDGASSTILTTRITISNSDHFYFEQIKETIEKAGTGDSQTITYTTERMASGWMTRDTLPMNSRIEYYEVSD